MRFAILVVLTGCLHTTYRYVDVPLPPDQTRAQLLRENEAESLDVLKPGCGAVICDREDALATTQPSEDPGRARWYSYNVSPHGTGSRVELVAQGAEAPPLPPLLASNPMLTIVPQPNELTWSDSLASDFELSLGVQRDPRGTTWRTNFIGQLGGRLQRFGELGDVPRPSYSLSLLGGPGIEVAGTGPALLTQLTLSLDRQMMVEPIAGEHLPMGPRYALDLSVAGVFFNDDDTGDGMLHRRNGVELGLTMRRVDIGGITARVGRMWGDGRGVTASVGVRILNPLYACFGAFGVGVLIAIAEIISHPGSQQLSGG